MTKIIPKKLIPIYKRNIEKCLTVPIEGILPTQMDGWTPLVKDCHRNSFIICERYPEQYSRVPGWIIKRHFICPHSVNWDKDKKQFVDFTPPYSKQQFFPHSTSNSFDGYQDLLDRVGGTVVDINTAEILSKEQREKENIKI